VRLLADSVRESFIRRVDPRIKILWALGNTLLAVLHPDWKFLCLLIFCALLGGGIAGIRPTLFLPLFKITGLFGFQFALLQAWLRPEGSVLIQWGSVALYSGGLVTGVEGILLLLTFTLFWIQFAVWTPAEDLGLLLTRLGIPCKYALLPQLALRFLPVLVRDLNAVFESQQSRGLELSGIVRKVRGLVYALPPLLFHAIGRSREVALFMELKGYTRYPRRTSLRSLLFTARDRRILGGCLAYFTVLAAWIAAH